MANPAPENPRETALQSYSGRRLSGSEFEDVYAITGIIARDIERTGSFFEVRKGYAFAYSRACHQLSQITVAARYMPPRNAEALLSYLVAIALYCLSFWKRFSIK